MKIFTRKAGDSEWTEIKDLYWFEEHGIHSFDEEDMYGKHWEFKFGYQEERIQTISLLGAIGLMTRDYIEQARNLEHIE